jgi:hypothetical protein
MKTAITTWKWSLGVVARSYRAVILLALLIALGAFGAYEWLCLPAESSALLMILSLIWALAQLYIFATVAGGTVAGAGDAAAADAGVYPTGAIWAQGRKKVAATLAYSILTVVLVWICGTIFDWVNTHSVEVASFLTFHSEKPVSHELLENIDSGIEGLLWIVVSGFLLSIFIVILRGGWRSARDRWTKVFAACTFRTPFFTSLLSVVVFGGLASKLMHWHPSVPAGFWDYAQVAARFFLAAFIVSAGVLFWSLSLARLMQSPSPQE